MESEISSEEYDTSGQPMKRPYIPAKMEGNRFAESKYHAFLIICFTSMNFKQLIQSALAVRSHRAKDLRFTLLLLLLFIV